MADAVRKVLRKALLTLDLPTESDPEAPDAHKRRADEHIAAWQSNPGTTVFGDFFDFV